MRVYLVDVGWDNYWADGIFSSPEAAMAARPDVEWARVEYPGEEVWEGKGRGGPGRITGYTLDERKQDK